jgi:hypothetical protein
MPRPPVQQVNTQTKVLDTVHGRILCIADIRGRLSHLNDLARDVNAKAVVHTGDFGFFGVFSCSYRPPTFFHVFATPFIRGIQSGAYQ